MTSTTTTDGAFLGRQSASATAASAASGPILGRMERLPLSLWHLKVRTIIGTATFFDGIDFLAIALALPVLVGAWHLTPVQVGLLISGSAVGQLIGAVGMGICSAWAKIAGIIAPTVIGWWLGSQGMAMVFLLLGAFFVAGALGTWLFAEETRRTPLEELSP